MSLHRLSGAFILAMGLLLCPAETSAVTWPLAEKPPAKEFAGNAVSPGLEEALCSIEEEPMQTAIAGLDAAAASQPLLLNTPMAQLLPWPHVTGKPPAITLTKKLNYQKKINKK